jgi:serine/threonine protein kinase
LQARQGHGRVALTVSVLPPGRILGGKYTLQALLRRTAWSSTHRAITSPNREVVLKILDGRLALRPDVLEAIRKAETAGSALPTHLALPVIEQGVDTDTLAPYIVTPRAATPSLEQLVELCPLSPAEAVAFMQNLGRALDAAHFAGYEHLALKPANVFVGPGPTCAVQVVDFGANAIRALVPEDVRLAFSAPWLAPEQRDGDAKAGPGADVFASALLAFFAMTGRSLWRSCRGTTPDLVAWRSEIERVPDRASVLAAEVGAVLDPAFDAAFAIALARPEARTKSVGVFAQALAEALGSVATAPPADASSVLATAVSLPPDAIEPELGEVTAAIPLMVRSKPPPAIPTPHVPTLTPPSAGSVPPAPAQESPYDSMGAILTASRGLPRPQTLPYWNDAALDGPDGAPRFPPLPATAAVAAAAAAAPPLPVPAVLVPVPAPPGLPGSPGGPPQTPGPLGGPPPPAVPLAGPPQPHAQAPAPPPAAAFAAIATEAPPATWRPPPFRSSKRWMAIAGGVVLGAVVGVLAFSRVRSQSGDGTVAVENDAGTRATASAAAQPATSYALPGLASGAAPGASAAEGPGPDTLPRPDDGELTIVCEPACDLIAVDSRVVTSAPRSIRLRPGVHGVGASRAHFGGQWKQVTLQPGEKATLTFKLTPSGEGSAPKKPCGQFLKRCRE